MSPLEVVAFLVATLLTAQGLVLGWLMAVNRRRKARRAPGRPPRPTLAPHVVGAQRITVYATGAQLYDDMLAAIRGARSEILLETYIWKDDALGRAFREALIERASAGVAVWVIYDRFANLVVPRRFFDFPPGIQVLGYRSIQSPLDLLSPRKWGRDHRKLLIVDRHAGFVGGFNIGALYRDAWHDTHLGIEGGEAHDLAFAFVDFWRAHARRRPSPPLPSRPWSADVRVHRNDPRRVMFPVRSIYVEAIEHATSHIHMTQAYFVPDRAMLGALKAAAARGVAVTVLVPWESNHVLVDWLARHLFEECLEAGIRIFGYQGVMIHSKTCTIDGVWSTIGTTNMDRLSLAGNYEINVELFDEAVAAEMDRLFAADLAHAREITLDAWRRRPATARAAELLLSPLWFLV